MRTRPIHLLALPAIAALIGVAMGTVQALPVSKPADEPARPEQAVVRLADGSVTLCAKKGSATIGTAPKAVEVPIFGFVAEACSGNTAPSLAGIRLEAMVGDEIEITLQNDLAEPVALALPGLIAGDTTDGIVPDEVGVIKGDTTTYSFTATRPGTFLIQAGGAQARWQIPMGLVAILVVRPSDAARAYSDGSTAYDTEATVLLAEVDPNLNRWVDITGGASFDFTRWAPSYWLLNGRTYVDSASDSDLTSGVGGKRLLLRYVNAGFGLHSLELLGARQRVIATDAYGPSTNVPPAYEALAVEVPAAGTVDVLIDVPNAVGSALPRGLVLWERGQAVTDGVKPARYPGGMIAYIKP